MTGGIKLLVTNINENEHGLLTEQLVEVITFIQSNSFQCTLSLNLLS